MGEEQEVTSNYNWYGRRARSYKTISILLWHGSRTYTDDKQFSKGIVRIEMQS
jgi:hypothetical protein